MVSPFVKAFSDSGIIESRLFEPATNFGAMLLGSVVAQPPVTVAIMLTAKKVAGSPYPEGLRALFTTSFGNLVQQWGSTLKRRTLASLLPSAASMEIARIFGLDPVRDAKTLSFINATLETIIANSIVKEAGERFNAINITRFPLIKPSGLGVDITKIRNFEEFRTFCANSPLTNKFGEAEWHDLSNRLSNYRSAFPYQASALLLRNTIFSSAIFYANPLAKFFVESEQDVVRSLGFSPETAETVLTQMIRVGLACATTPCDRVFTQLSSGQSVEEVFSALCKDLLNLNLLRICAGAGGRTALCFITSNVTAESLKLAKTFRDSVKEGAIARDMARNSSEIMRQAAAVASSSASASSPELPDRATLNRAIQGSGLRVSYEDVRQSVEAAHKFSTQLGQEFAASLKTPSATVLSPGAKKVVGRVVASERI